MKKKIELTDTEQQALRLILCSRIEKFVDRQEHAMAHGGELHSVDVDAFTRILDKIDAE